MARWWRRATAHAAALAAVGVCMLPAAATTPPDHGVPVLELAGQTVIHWRGTTAVRIHVAKNVWFPRDGDVRLISHGHYAFIRVDPTSACQHDVPHCGTGMIDWTPALSDMMGKGYAAHHGGAGTDITYAIQDPEGLSKGWSVFYLASDGESTLELTTRDLTGRRDVRLNYRAPIIVQRLPVNCGLAAGMTCDSGGGYASRMVFGGATHDVGKSGFAQAIVVNSEGSDQLYDATGAVPNYQPLGVVGCVYGPGMSVSEDPNAADHPTGCDIAAKSPGEADAVEAGQFTFTSVNPDANGQAFWRGDAHRSGPTYLGFMMDSPLNLPHPKWQEAWGIWFPYLTP